MFVGEFWETEGRGDSLATFAVAYTKAGLIGAMIAVPLCLFAFLTNPVPDPSFPWLHLPEAYRLPFTQPRIEHWPVSYTIGLWIWVFSFPAFFFAGWSWFGRDTRRSTSLWLVAAPAILMIGWAMFCRWIWMKPEPATWNAPSYSFVCWAYCSSYIPTWSNAALTVGGFGLVTALWDLLEGDHARWLMIAYGIVALPIGLPVLFAGLQRRPGRSPLSDPSSSQPA